MREKSAQAGLHTGIPSCVARRKLVTSASYSTPVAPGGAESQGVGKHDSPRETTRIDWVIFRPYAFLMIEAPEVQPLPIDRLRLRKGMSPADAAPLSREIMALKKELNAVILAHNYQVPEIQDVADFVGDSLGLSQQAAKTNADVIVFCGVHFMAETAKILNPNKIVVLPDKHAGCSLEESCPADKLAELQKTNPNFWTIAYINCSAEVKALCDVIVTSGNAVKIVNAAPKDKDLLFVPDENLGAWVMEQTGRPMTLWKGNCYAHVEFRRDAILRLRKQFPDAKIVVHPESLREVRDLADAVASTEKMITYCKTDPAKKFVIVTESGIIHRMQKECPGKEFICAPTFDVMRMPTDNCRCSECKYMKMNTLQKVRDCMKNLAPRIELPEHILKRARLPIERMLEISAR
jgi:quinolinate synthase